MKDFLIRPIQENEIEDVAKFISTGYYDDIFFKWVVDNDDVRHEIVTNYYKVYLTAKGSKVAVIKNKDNILVAASVWLPHDVDISIYDDIDKVAGKYANNFRSVADKSHYSEPPMTPFYQLVGVVVDKEFQGLGLGKMILEYQINQFDTLNIPTYLEASTPYNGSGVYANFGYQPVGELMNFENKVYLYPLWRNAKPYKQVRFGKYNWTILDVKEDKVLLILDNVIDNKLYHDNYEEITYDKSSIRNYLNNDFYNTFNGKEKDNIIETNLITNDNPWYSVSESINTLDKVFILSIEDVVKYFGDSGKLKNPDNKYYIDDIYNHRRICLTTNNEPSRWFLRNPGNTSNFVSLVTCEGKISITGDFVNRPSTDLFNVGVRPTIWVKKEGIE